MKRRSSFPAANPLRILRSGCLLGGILLLAAVAAGPAATVSPPPASKETQTPALDEFLHPSEGEPDLEAAAAAIESLAQEKGSDTRRVVERRLDGAPAPPVIAAELAAQSGDTLNARRLYREILREWESRPEPASDPARRLRAANLEFLRYRVRALDDQWLKMIVHRLAFLFLAVTVSLGIYAARRGVRFPIREIAGVSAIPDAVGRATEMGRPSLFSISLSDMEDPETFAAMPVLKYVARLSARLKSRLIIPILGERTIPLIRNTYREGCLEAGNPDAFDPANLRFFPGGQFFYAIASMGYMLRERPASCFYFGRWEAESLMFGETGQVIQALQIAATPQLFQVPFFIAACDYVIIGEEFYAASALLGENPTLRGSLAGQDVVKLVILAVILAGVVAVTFGPLPLREWIGEIVRVLRN